MGKKALIFLAPGFEEVEAVTPMDYLRRAGVEVTAAAVGKDPAVTGAHGIGFTADTTTAALEAAGALETALWDAAVIPGGMPGSTNLAASPAVGNFFKAMAAAAKITAAICAAPAVVLAPLGLLEGKRWTCYPGAEQGISGGTWSADPVVADGPLITSRAAGTAAAFSLALVTALTGKAEAEKLTAAVLL